MRLNRFSAPFKSHIPHSTHTLVTNVTGSCGKTGRYGHYSWRRIDRSLHFTSQCTEARAIRPIYRSWLLARYRDGIIQGTDTSERGRNWTRVYRGMICLRHTRSRIEGRRVVKGTIASRTEVGVLINDLCMGKPSIIEFRTRRSIL